MSESSRYELQPLEPRTFLSAGHGQVTWEELTAAKAKGRNAPAIRLDLVALHEFGHALGLGHTTNANSIMYAYYNPNYNLSNFASDPIIPTLLSKFANVTSSAWNDPLDPNPGNGRVDVTYSFVPDGTSLDRSASRMFQTFDAIFGRAAWQAIFDGMLQKWEDVSGGKLNFIFRTDSGAPAGAAGAAQNDSRFGDIRIGAHRFDGAGKVLAHAYFPPPNGGTLAGDTHFDYAENWVAGPAPITVETFVSAGKVGRGSVAALTFDVDTRGRSGAEAGGMLPLGDDAGEEDLLAAA